MEEQVQLAIFLKTILLHTYVILLLNLPYYVLLMYH